MVRSEKYGPSKQTEIRKYSFKLDKGSTRKEYLEI